MENVITQEALQRFAAYLRREEKSTGTVEKYLRDTAGFTAHMDGAPVTKESAAAWRDELLARGYAPVTVNSMVAAVNALLRFLGWEDCRVKSLRLQRRAFRDPSRELNREEYERLVAAAQGNSRLALLLEAICGTGIRVSEVKYPGKLCRKLLQYARKQKTASGEIFLTRSGKSLNRRQIWAEMKALCGKAGVEASKVFPHNLRHLFARTFYEVTRDIVRLSDVLGHSSVETTRIYLVSTGAEHARIMERLGLVS